MWIVDYELQYWINWKDYFEIYVQWQTELEWQTLNDRNLVMRKYLDKYKYSVNIWDIKSFYIMFTTRKPISKDKKLFLWLEWVSKWAINMENKYDTDYDNQYLFDSDHFSAWGYPIIFKNHIPDWKIILWWYVWEKDNTITKITIVKK